MSRAIEVTVAPFLPSLLISSILSTPIISSLAPNRRNRSNDNGRPNGMVGVPALRPETFSRLFPKIHRAQTRNTETIKHTRSSGARGWSRCSRRRRPWCASSGRCAATRTTPGRASATSSTGGAWSPAASASPCPGSPAARRGCSGWWRRRSTGRGGRRSIWGEAATPGERPYTTFRDAMVNWIPTG